MKKYIISIMLKYGQDDWIQKNQKYLAFEKDNLTSEDVKKIIDSHLNKIEDNYSVEVVFSGIDTEEKQNLLNVAYKYLNNGKINSIKVITRPEFINKKTLMIFKKYKVKTIELELGSTNEYILKGLGRNYTLSDLKKVTRKIRWRGFKLGVQIFVGLPDSTQIDDINTAKTILKLRPKEISITPVLIYKNTPLEKDFQEKKYKPLSVVQAVEACKEIVKLANERHIETIEIGYGVVDNDNEQLQIAEKVVEGPFQPSFRQLVESSLWYDAVLNKIKKINMKVNQVELIVNPIDVNNVIGYKQENINKLKDIYNVELIISSDENIKPGKSICHLGRG